MPSTLPPTSTVLVTGGSGFVGRHVVRAVADRGYRVIATHADPPGSKRPAHRRVRWLRWDGTRDPLPRVAWPRIGAIVHLAVPGNLFTFPDNASALYELDVGATFRLLEAARRHRLHRVLIASTGYSLGRMSRRHREADHDYDPETFYGTTKACAELLARAYQETLSTAVIRFYWPYGPGGGRFLIQRLLKNLAEGRELFVEGRDGMILNPVWIEDLAGGVVRALESNATGTFHFAGPETVTMRNLIDRMAQALGKKASIRIAPAARNRYQAADFNRATQVLGYRPRVRLERGLRLLAKTLLTNEGGGR
jgi:nucleoside-diphosphate-sugar epimerase